MAMVPKGKKASNIDNTARRVWDKDEFREKAAEREKQEAKARISALLHLAMLPPSAANP